jgi:CheY-like chemotaxis protein
VDPRRLAIARFSLCPWRLAVNETFSSLRVLIVEDEALIAMLLGEMLLDLGAAVAGMATNIDEAFALLQDSAINAAILDININGCGSFPVADALKARGIPYAFATGFDEGALPVAYASDRLIQKPFMTADIERALSEFSR